MSYEPLLKNIGKALREITVFIENGLDQPVNIQLLGNRVNSPKGAVNVGSSFTVPANSNDARTLTPDTSGWLPFITVRVWCTAAPTSGALNIYLVQPGGGQRKIVDSLAIRDTNMHDASTDPNNIFIVEW